MQSKQQREGKFTMKKRLLAAGLAGAMALSLTACGAKEETAAPAKPAANNLFFIVNYPSLCCLDCIATQHLYDRFIIPNYP